MKLAAFAIAILFVCECQDSLQQVNDFKVSPYQADERNLVKLSVLTDGDKQNDGTKTYTPVVLWHGMGDTANGSVSIIRLALQKMYQGMKVLSIQIGKDAVEDELSGFFSNVNDVVDQACEEVLKSDIIKQHGSFNAIGFSQGGQFMRALIQRCPLSENNIKVKNFISLGGQHQGVYGLPNCFSPIFCSYIKEVLSYGAYNKEIQEHVVQAQYWHDPLDENSYRKKNIFLADINNENRINKKYVENLASLDCMVLVKFLQDEMVVPRESSLFGFFVPGRKDQVQSMEQTRTYKEDRLGLREMKQSKKLVQIEIPGRHLQFTIRWFLDNIASVYLDN